MGKQTACPCDAFTEAVRTAFLDKIGDEFFLASRDGGPGLGSHFSLIYGPKISHCPFCGSALEKETRTPMRY